MTDAIQKFASNARGAEYAFLPAVAYALEQFRNKNNLPMYRMIAFVNGKTFTSDEGKAIAVVSGGEQGAKLTEFATPLKRVLNRALSDVQFKTVKGKMRAVVGDNGGVNGDVLNEITDLLKLYNNRVSARGDAFKSMFPAPVREKKEKSLQEQQTQLANYLTKFAETHKISLQAAIAMASNVKVDAPKPAPDA